MAKRLEGTDREKVREWYNGYNFNGEHVYNPFDILLFIDSGFIFDNYWFATGTPTFLIKLIQRQNYFIPQLENLRVSRSLIDSFNIEDIKVEPILFQAGYLTIKEVKESRRGGQEYLLGIPNREVNISFNDSIIDYLTSQNVEKFFYQDSLFAALENGDIGELEDVVEGLFASIPYNNYVNNTISSYEGYYAGVIYAYLASLGLDLIAEDVTSKGRIDLTIKLGDNIYILEFKVDGRGDALTQIKERNYQQKYLAAGKEIYLLGIHFSSEKKNIAGFDWEKLKIIHLM
ncbi:MAG: hypothetical protein D3909_08510 [Candidatus Electrothrix sp. ATG1]|nr:hypothetical protein [Candidatus Electrothrix sp. ATG1]